MTEKVLGKISSVSVGMGGYQEAMFGVSFSFTFEGGGVGDFKGTWARDPDKHCQWTKESQGQIWADMCRFLIQTMKDAKVDSVEKLKGVPVEVTIVNNSISSWRVLKEVR